MASPTLKLVSSLLFAVACSTLCPNPANATLDRAFVNNVAAWNTTSSSFDPMVCNPTQLATTADVYDPAAPMQTCGTLLNPCLLGVDEITATNLLGCGFCYVITLRTPTVIDTRCTGGSCRAYSSTIVGQATNSLSSLGATRKFDVSSLGWTQLCPVVCEGTGTVGVLTTCTQTAAECVNPRIRGSFNDPPSASVGAAQEIRWQKIDCQSGRDVFGDQNKNGEVDDYPESPTTLSTAATTTSAAVAFNGFTAGFLLAVGIGAPWLSGGF